MKLFNEYASCRCCDNLYDDGSDVCECIHANRQKHPTNYLIAPTYCCEDFEPHFIVFFKGVSEERVQELVDKIVDETLRKKIMNGG